MRLVPPMLWTVVCMMSPPLACSGEPEERREWHPRVVLQAGQEVRGDYFAFGPQVEISGTVHGDVYAAGGDVLVDGVVDGDLIVAGGKVTLAGTVSQDVRMVGGEVTLGGNVGRNITVGGGEVQLTDAAQIRGNLLAGAGTVHLAGRIGGDARIGAGHVTISREIAGDVAVAAAAARLTSNARVGGNLRYWGKNAPSIDGQATVRGTVTQQVWPGPVNAEEFRHGLAGFRLAVAVVSVVSTLMLGLLVLWIYPVFSRSVAEKIHERPWSSLGVGGILLAGVPLLALLCLLTVVGIPLGIMLATLYAVTLYLGRVFVMLWAGRFLLGLVSTSSSPAWAFIAGVVLYTVLTLIPVIGGFVTIVAMLLGLGALILTKVELVARLRAQQMV